jgi:hypothetical protein
MRAQRPGLWLLALSMVLLAAACQPADARTAPQTTAPTLVPIAMFEVTPVSTSTPVPTPAAQTPSGVYLNSQISPMCTGATRVMAECVQPYAGEFVVTELNGEVVTNVMTDEDGQATIELPPGKYILGVRTEKIYPLAAPVKINILPDRYVHISLSLDSGLPRQSQSR